MSSITPSMTGHFASRLPVCDLAVEDGEPALLFEEKATGASDSPCISAGPERFARSYHLVTVCNCVRPRLTIQVRFRSSRLSSITGHEAPRLDADKSSHSMSEWQT